jgi:hypothetical protein
MQGPIVIERDGKEYLSHLEKTGIFGDAVGSISEQFIVDSIASHNPDSQIALTLSGR